MVNSKQILRFTEFSFPEFC